MLQFKDFPIFVNMNYFSDEERAAALQARKKKFYSSAGAAAYMKELEDARRKYGQAVDYKQYEFEAQVDNIDRRLDEIRTDGMSNGNWEREVIKHLTTIASTRIGNLLIRCLRKTVKVWIVFDDGSDPGAASTTPGVLSDEAGGGVRLHFDPFGFNDSGFSYTPGDVLFHELVHAYRSGWKGIDGSNWRKLEQYKSAEEFLAIHLQNVYLHYIGAQRFYLSHSVSTISTEGEVYANIARSRETLEVLNYYLYHEPFVREIAKWTEPKCNVWRDYQRILGRSSFRAALPSYPVP